MRYLSINKWMYLRIVQYIIGRIIQVWINNNVYIYNSIYRIWIRY
jgi:hypothetical protein